MIHRIARETDARSPELVRHDDAGRNHPLARLSDHKLLTAAEERALFQQLDQTRARRAAVDDVDLQAELDLDAARLRNRIAESNMRLVAGIVCGLRSPDHSDFWELMSEGTSALLNAVDAFQVSKGYRFSTYATTVVKRAAWKFLNVAHKRSQRQGLSLHESDLENFRDPNDHRETTERERSLERVISFVDELDERERTIVLARFGIGQPKVPMHELARQLKLSREGVRKILRRTLTRLRTQLEAV